jgi:hypothetical protein
LLRPTERFRKFVAVLITRHCEKSQKCNHGRHSAAHIILSD